MVNPNFLLKDKNGTPVGVSPLGTIFLLYFNKDVMKAAGIDPNIEIKTWNDWKTVSDKITATGKYFGGGVPTHPHAGGALRASPFIRQLGADFGGGSTVTINTPEMIRALTFIREMNKNIPKGVGNNPDEGAIGKLYFTDKTLASVINGTWLIRDNANNKIDAATYALPIPDGGKKANCLVAFCYFGVTTVSKNKDAAFNVIRAFLDKDVAKGIITNDYQLVANKEVLDDTSNYQNTPALATAVSEMKTGAYTGLAVWDKNDAQIWNVIDTEILARTTMTNDPIEKIVSEAQTKVENLLK
jgi:multiple sugar transport system substrate-binding protein